MSCTHHWVIEPPQGKTSTGICKHCQESREFQNSFSFSKHWKQTIKTRGKGHGLTKSQIDKKLGERVIR